jgi:hypothetical protein
MKRISFDDPNINCQPGDILLAKNNYNQGKQPPHPMVYLGTGGPDYFLGAMLSTSMEHGNILMDKAHFETIDENGKAYSVSFKPSFMADDLLKKKMEWAPFKKKGKLTPEGLAFVLAQLDGKKEKESSLNKK